MKTAIKILLVLPLIYMTSLISLKGQEIPKKGFNVLLSSNTIELGTTDSASADISILRSKRFKNAEVGLKVSGAIPDGVSITFDSSSTLSSTAKMNITVENGAAPGTYMLILYAKTPEFRKGTTFKLVIS